MITGWKRFGAGAVVGALVLGLPACGGDDDGGDVAAGSTTTAAGAGAGGSSTTASGSGSGSGAGSTSTTAAGRSAGVQAGGTGIYRAFRYTVRSGTLSPSRSADKQDLKVTLDVENLAKASHQATANYGAFKLDGDQFQVASDAEATPSGAVPGGTKGTVLVTFEVGTTFDASKVGLQIGDPNAQEVPVLPLGPDARKVTQEPKDQAISATTPGTGKNGVTFTATKATLSGSFAADDKQAEKDQQYLLISGSFKGGAEATSLSYTEVKLKQPDGTIKAVEGFFDVDDTEGSISVSAGQTKEATLVAIVEDKAKAAGAYELQVQAETGDVPASAAFTLT